MKSLFTDERKQKAFDLSQQFLEFIRSNSNDSIQTMAALQIVQQVVIAHLQTQFKFSESDAEKLLAEMADWSFDAVTQMVSE